MALNCRRDRRLSRQLSGGIVLQKSKVAGLRIFAKNPKREAIAN